MSENGYYFDAEDGRLNVDAVSDDVARIVDARNDGTAGALGFYAHVSSGVHAGSVRWAAVQFAADAHPCCAHRTRPVGFTWIDDRGGNCAPVECGERSGECSGCGRHNYGIALGEARMIDHATDVDDLVSDAEDVQRWARELADDAAESRMARMVGEVWAAIHSDDPATESPYMDPDTLTDPGLYYTTRGWLAWDFDPREEGETLTVDEHSLVDAIAQYGELAGVDAGPSLLSLLRLRAALRGTDDDMAWLEETSRREAAEREASTHAYTTRGGAR